MRSALRFFTVQCVYCLLFAHLVADGSWRAGMLGASIANGFAVLYLAIVRRWGSDDG